MTHLDVITYHKLPEKFNLELSFDWSNETQTFWQGYVPYMRKDFEKISVEIDKIIKSFFIDNKILPHKGIYFYFFAFNTYWQFEVVYVQIESDGESDGESGEINLCKIYVYINCHCAEIKEEFKKELMR